MAAVIYHAEAKWSGAYQPFEQVVKSLAKRQIDCDIVPIDTIVNKEAMVSRTGCLEINGETFSAVPMIEISGEWQVFCAEAKPFTDFKRKDSIRGLVA